MNNEENYIKRNRRYIVNNCISNYLWKNTSFSETIKKSSDYERKWNMCNPANMETAIIKLLETMTDENGVNRFILDLKKQYVRPFYKTVQNFIDGEYETDGLTASKISAIIYQQLAEIR